MTNGTKFPPVEMIIFGAASDLIWRKLAPVAAAYNPRPTQIRRMK